MAKQKSELAEKYRKLKIELARVQKENARLSRLLASYENEEDVEDDEFEDDDDEEI